MKRAFTLVELLTVIAIIGILAAICIPVVGKVREAGRAATCKSNLRQIGVALSLFAADNRGRYPRGLTTVGGNSTGWMSRIDPYLGADESGRAPIRQCPSVANPRPQSLPSHYSGNTAVFGRLTYEARLTSEIDRPSQLVTVIDGRQRAIASGEAHSLLAAATYGDPLAASPRPANTPVPTNPTGEQVIDYRHASDSAHALMADGSVSVFPRGSLLYRHFDIRL